MQPVCLQVDALKADPRPGPHLLTMVLGLAAALLTGFGCSQSSADLSSAPSPKEKELSEEAAPVGMTAAEASLLEESAVAGYKTPKFPLFVYQDAGVASFYPDGWMGDYNDIKLSVYCDENPRSGKTCIKINYLPGASQNSKWAGVFWQYPGSQWGKKKGGYDLTGAKKLKFWARGEKGGEVIQEVKMGGISGKFKDSDTAGIGPITLSTDWKEFEIDLSGVDLSYISGGFCWSTSLEQNRGGCVFYLDDIVYE